MIDLDIEGYDEIHLDDLLQVGIKKIEEFHKRIDASDSIEVRLGLRSLITSEKNVTLLSIPKGPWKFPAQVMLTAIQTLFKM